MIYEQFRILTKVQNYDEVYETSSHILAIKYYKGFCRYLLLPQDTITGGKYKKIPYDDSVENWPLSLIVPPNESREKSEEWRRVREMDFPFVFGGMPAKSKKKEWL